MLWRGLTLLKTTHNHRHGRQGASQCYQQSDGHGGSCRAGDFRVAPMHRPHHMSCQRADNAMLDLVVEGGTMRELRRRNALFFLFE